MTNIIRKWLYIFISISLVISPLQGLGDSLIMKCDMQSMSTESSQSHTEHNALNIEEKCKNCKHQNCCCEGDQCRCNSLILSGLLNSLQSLHFIEMISGIMEDDVDQKNHLNILPLLRPPIS